MRWQLPDKMTAHAMLAVGLMMAQMTEAKAIRDSVFLTHFPVSSLPTMVMAAAVFAMMASYFGSRMIRATPPDKFAPVAFLISGLLQVGERSLLFSHPRVASSVIYLHVFAINLMLTSSFWSLMNEHYDPRSAKKAFGKIAGMGTFGGIIGGLVAERVAAMGSVPALILVTAALHIACGGALFWFTRKHPVKQPHEAEVMEGHAAHQVLKRSPYLIELAALMISVSVAAALLDYVFKSQVASSIPKGPALTRFFAVFYTATGLLGFGLQTFVTSALLSRLGVVATVAMLPMTVLGGGALVLAFRGLIQLTILRATEVVLKGSLFRSGYELFYTPVAAADKRAVKAIIDVNGERIGDAIGSGITSLILLLHVNATGPILSGALVFAAAGLLIAKRLDRSYATALGESLRNQSPKTEDPTYPDMMYDSMVIPPELPEAAASPPSEIDAVRSDPTLLELTDLRCEDSSRVINALVRTRASHPMVVHQLIQFLAVDEYAFLAMDKLRRVAPAHVGLLADALLSRDGGFVVRKRIPFILAQGGSQRALDILISALSEEDFLIRFRSAYAVQQLRTEHPELQLSPDRVWRIIAKELQVSRDVWEERSLAEKRAISGDEAAEDESEKPGEASLQYLFILLGLVLPREPVSMAFRALQSEDKHLRGTALEYLETVLPGNTWKALEGLIGDRIITKRATRT